MSDATLTANDPVSLRSETAKTASTGLLAGGVALLVAALYFGQSDRHYFAFAWLWSFMYFYTIVAGGLFWTMLHHATNGGWGTLVRRQSENLASLAVVLAVLFVPVLLLRHELWSWLNAKEVLHDEAFLAKQGYFTFPGTHHGSFFYFRMFFYFCFWIGAAYFFRSNSVRQDASGSPVYSTRMQKWSYGFIPLFAICITFSAIDWIMTLDYHWYSTMWGVYIFAGTAGSSMATLILVIYGLKAAGVLNLVNKEHTHIMGKLLFAFTIFWAYIAFSQYMLIWYAKIPEETDFFYLRNVGTWRYVAIWLVIARFGIPFLLLLTQGTKKNPWRLGVAAGWILMMHAFDHYWILMPYVQPAGWAPHLIDPVIWLGMAGVLSGVFLRLVLSANLYPVRDPRLGESIHVKN